MYFTPDWPNQALETCDFFLETPEQDDGEDGAMQNLNEALQVEDGSPAESGQSGIWPASVATRRTISDPGIRGKSEQAVQSLQGSMLDANARAAL